jgi:hypothetical protein
MWATGVGGPITGFGADLAIIDDPLKGAEEAGSVTIRTKQQEWYQSVLSTRLHPGAAVVVVQTRWHEDDLSGWLLRDSSLTSWYYFPSGTVLPAGDFRIVHVGSGTPGSPTARVLYMGSTEPLKNG